MKLIARSVVCLVVWTSFALAQQSPNVEEGLKPYGAYHGGDIDSVSLTNGNLNIHIPLLSYPQRGGKLEVGWVLIHNNKGWFAHFDSIDQVSGQPIYDWEFKGDGVKVAQRQL